MVKFAGNRRMRLLWWAFEEVYIHSGPLSAEMMMKKWREEKDNLFLIWIKII